MAKQAKCNFCKVLWFWKSESWVRKISDIACPQCFGQLEATTEYLSWQVKEMSHEKIETMKELAAEI